MGASLVRGLLIAVDQHHVDPRHRRDIGDPRAHHPRADHAHFLHTLVAHVRPHGALLQRALIDEQRPDHRRRGRVHQHVGEPPRLDAERRVEIDQRALVDRRQHRLGCRIRALRLSMHHRRRADEGHVSRRMIRRAARHPVALRVPRLHDVSVRRREHPCLRRRQQLVGRHDLIDQPGGLRLLGVVELALQQERRRRHHAHLAHQPRRSAHTRKDPDHDLRQADLGLGIVRREDPVARQRDLQPDPQRRAGQGRRHRLAALVGLRIHPGALQPAQDPVHPHQPVHQTLRRLISRVLLHLRDDVEVHAAREIRFAGGQHDPLDRVVRQRGVDAGVELGDALHVQHVHRLARQVPGDGRHAVRVGLAGEDAHLSSPSAGG